MNKGEILQHLAGEVYCRLRASRVQGVGVFAVKDIPIHTDPFPNSYRGEYQAIAEDEASSLEPGVKEMIRDFCVDGEGGYQVPLCGLNRLDVSFFVNHSESPNLMTIDGSQFFSTRLIKAGEELLVDYRTYSEPPRAV